MASRERLSSSASSCSSSSSYCSSWRGIFSGSRRSSSATNSRRSPTEPLTLFDDVKFILSRHDDKLSKLEDDLDFMVCWLNKKFGFMVRHGSTSSIASDYDEVKALETDLRVPDLQSGVRDLEKHSSEESLHEVGVEDVCDEKEDSRPDSQKSFPIDDEDVCDTSDEEPEDNLQSSSEIGYPEDGVFLEVQRSISAVAQPAITPAKKQVRKSSRNAPSYSRDNETQLPSQCDTCGKFLKDPSSLRQHKQIHLNIRPFLCPEPGCGKSFRRKFHMQTHLLIHNGIKKHQCGYCGRLFLLQKDLVSHERIHTGERPFQCPECPKSFNLKSHLVMHVRTHTGEKPYKCDICSKCFSQSNSLRLHRKKVHVEQNSKVAQRKQMKKRAASKKKTVIPKQSKSNLSIDSQTARLNSDQTTSTKLPIYKNQKTIRSFTSFATKYTPTTLTILQPMPVTRRPLEIFEQVGTEEHNFIFPSSSFNISSTAAPLPMITSTEIFNIAHSDIPVTRH